MTTPQSPGADSVAKIERAILLLQGIQPNVTDLQAAGIQAAIDALSHTRDSGQGAAVAWQFRVLLNRDKGQFSEWVDCSKDDLYGLYAKEKDHEVRELFTHPAARNPLPMSSAPRGDIVRLLVTAEDANAENNPLADSAEPTWTIGVNLDDEWLYVGWDWDNDCFTEGYGSTPIGWLPFAASGIGNPPATSGHAEVTEAMVDVAIAAHMSVGNAHGTASTLDRIGMRAALEAALQSAREKGK